jgi:acyl carrier protein
MGAIVENSREQLILKFKSEVIEACGVQDITADKFCNDDPLFGNEGLTLDSLDALEVIMLMEQNFGIKIKGKQGSNNIFKSFNTIADHIFEKTSQDVIESYAKS